MASVHMHKLAFFLMFATVAVAAVTGNRVSRKDKHKNDPLFWLSVGISSVAVFAVVVLLCLLCFKCRKPSPNPSTQPPQSMEPSIHSDPEDLEPGEGPSIELQYYSTPGYGILNMFPHFDASHSSAEPEAPARPHTIAEGSAHQPGALPVPLTSIGLPRGVHSTRGLSTRLSISQVHQNRPDTIYEVSTASDLAPPASPTTTVRASDVPERSEITVAITQDFSHKSLVPAPLTVKKQRSVKEDSSPVGTGISEGINDSQLRRTLSSPVSKRENAQSSHAAIEPELATSAENESEELEYLQPTVYEPPKIPEKSQRRSSQRRKIASSRPLVAKDLPPLPPRSDLDTLPSQSRGYIPRSFGHRDGLDRILYNAPAERNAWPLFPAISHDASQYQLPASYASSQCLPNVGSTATFHSVDSNGFGDATATTAIANDIAGSGPRPRRGNIAQDDARPDFAALREQHRQRQQRRGKNEDDNEIALYDSDSVSDFNFNFTEQVYAGPVRK
ncbi:hypothetical protein F5X99DRAFT_404959 [Biscogniauxia marginata]|nr:hypothetical protein F5X99DRAFT_404959 [Biscogniauxia marginata]